MKVIYEEKTIKEVTAYEAVDGTKFLSKEECEKYEKSARGVINARFKSRFGDEIINDRHGVYWDETIFASASCESEFFALDIESQDDINTLLMYIDLNGLDIYGRDRLTIGHIYIEIGEYSVDIRGTREQIVKQLVADLDHIDEKGKVTK